MSRLRWYSLGVGVVALLGCALGALVSPEQFFRAYLASFHYVLGIGLGCFVVLMVYHLTGGAWGFLIRRMLEAGSRTIPLLALLFIPIACGTAYLFPWAQPAVVEASANLQHKQVYLNLPFFWVRAAAYFLGWLVVAFFLNQWSQRQDRTGDPGLTHRLGRLAAIGLVVYGIALHFASIDWLMSLEPAFHSTIFGPLLATRHLVSAVAFVAIVLACLAARPPLADFVSKEVLNDIGNLLLTFLVMWAYMVYFQFMLVWIADLRHEVIWYLPRTRGGWEWLVWALVIFGFAVPFFLLLLRDVKREPRALACVAGLVLLTQLLFSYYEVVPAFPGTTLADHWMDFVMPLGLGGVWLACFLWQLARFPLLPAHDPSQETALHYKRLDAEEALRLQEVSHV